MRRTITLVLALLLTASAFSCGSGEAESSATSGDNSTVGTDTTEETARETDGLPEKDMDGFELRINHFAESGFGWALIKLDAEAETGDRLSDAIYKRNRKVEERFNCKISVSEQASIQAGDVQREALSGDPNYDLWLTYDIWTLQPLEYLMAWEDVPYVNLDKEWWNPMATEVFSLGGKTYAAAGNYSLAVLSRSSGFAFNKGLYEDLNISDDIYSLARDGKWTLDKMYDMAKTAYADLNGNSEMDEEDRYGIGGSWKETFWRFMLGSGVKMISKDENDELAFTLPGDKAAIDKMLRIYDLFEQDGIYLVPKKDVNSEDVFRSKRLLFHVVNLFDLERMRAFEIEIGVVPCPKYDEAQERYYAPSFGSEISVLLKNLPQERLENVGILLEALAYDTNKNIIPEYKEVLLKTKFARDNESEDMIDIMIDSVSFEFGVNAWQDTLGLPIIKKIYEKKDPSVASILAGMSSSIDSAIAKMMDKVR